MSQSARERRRLQRWIAAMGLIDAAFRSSRADTPETNAMSLLAAHAAAETLLGLIVGQRAYKRGEDIPFPRLVKDADEALKNRNEPALAPDLLDDLDGMHRARNGFVHAASAVHTSEVDQAISAARELTDHVAVRTTDASGIATAVAGVIDIGYVAMWLRHGEDMLRQGRVVLAADGFARALDGAIQRTRPRLVDRHGRRLSRGEQMRSLQSIGHGGALKSPLESFARAIEGLSDWVVPLALGLSPAGYASVRGVVGYESRMDMGGVPSPVDRPRDEPSEDDVQRAAASVSLMVFQLWATGALENGRGDQELIRLAQPFIAAPRGISAGERGIRTPHPDKPDTTINDEPLASPEGTIDGP